MEDLTDINAFCTYEEMDMYGTSMTRVIDALNLSLNAELAYRPNEPAQVYKHSMGMGVPAGAVPTRTLNWVLGGMWMLTDIFKFMPWVVNSTPMFECYGGNNLDYNNIEELDKENTGLYFTAPEHTAYYMVMFGLDSSDMIDNTKISFNISAMGSLHKEENSLHTITPSITANYGDNIEIMLGYEYKIGEISQVTPGPNQPDRDAFTFKFTWHYI
jgi:hypothetical protein